MKLVIQDNGHGAFTQDCQFLKHDTIEIKHPDGDTACQVDLADLRKTNGLAEWILRLRDTPWSSPALVAEFATLAADVAVLGKTNNPTDHSLFEAMRDSLE